jgi:hypothetical protein
VLIFYVPAATWVVCYDCLCLHAWSLTLLALVHLIRAKVWICIFWRHPKAGIYVLLLVIVNLFPGFVLFAISAMSFGSLLATSSYIMHECVRHICCHNFKLRIKVTVVNEFPRTSILTSLIWKIMEIKWGSVTARSSVKLRWFSPLNSLRELLKFENWHYGSFPHLKVDWWDILIELHVPKLKGKYSCLRNNNNDNNNDNNSAS